MQTLFDYWLFLPDALAPNALSVDSQHGRDPSEICEYDVFHGVPSARLLNLKTLTNWRLPRPLVFVIVATVVSIAREGPTLPIIESNF